MSCFRSRNRAHFAVFSCKLHISAAFTNKIHISPGLFLVCFVLAEALFSNNSPVLIFVRAASKTAVGIKSRRREQRRKGPYFLVNHFAPAYQFQRLINLVNFEAIYLNGYTYIP